MLLPGSNIKTDTVGITNSSAFKVGDAGVILDILRTKIYKDPIMAICREITCNARDAHREVGTPERPIEIEFPTLWNSGQLRIRDFGPGISPDRMTEIFIAFGRSTKRSDNVQTGGFGLGAKTPFAYTDSFTIVTVVDGLKYTYAAYIDETKVGKMDLMGKPVPTDEENGTTIIIGLAKNDVATFSSYMIKCTKHWDVKPIFHGLNDQYTYPDLTAQYEGTGWAFPNANVVAGNRSYYHSTYKSYAIVDGIEYEIDPNAIKDLTEVERTLLGTGFFLYYNVGDLVLAASRDNLHYEETTNKMIKDRLAILEKELIEIVQDKIKNAATYPEAVQAYLGVKDVFNRANLMNHISDIKWRGHDIRANLKVSDFGTWATIQTYYWDTFDNKVRKENTASIEFLKDTVLYVHDIKHKHVPRYLTEYLTHSKNQKRIQVLALRDVPYSVDYHNAVKKAVAKNKPKPEVKYEKKWLDLLGFKSLDAELQAMPKSAHKKRNSGGKLKKKDNHILGYEISACYDNNTGFSTESTSFDPEDGGYYFQVDLKTNSLSSDGNNIAPKLVSTTISAAHKLLDGVVVAFSKSRVNQIKRHGFDKDWKPVWPALVEAVKEKSDAYDWDAYNEAVKNHHHSWRWYAENFNLLARHFDKLDPNCYLVKWFQKSNETKAIINSDGELRQMARKILKKDFRDPPKSRYDISKAEDSECRDLYKEAKRRYPLLWMLDKYVSNQDKKYEAIVHYVNTVDGYTPPTTTKEEDND
jgi:hypothetical protein